MPNLDRSNMCGLDLQNKSGGSSMTVSRVSHEPQSNMVHPHIHDFDELGHPQRCSNGCDTEAQNTSGRDALQDKQPTDKQEGRLSKLSDAARAILQCVGENPEREGLLKTPNRYAQALLFFTQGYQADLQDILNGALFHEAHDGMVVVQDVEFYSLCEHHLVPFFGKIHIGYIPDAYVIGLSKIARVVEVFSRRLQVQERLTREIAAGLSKLLKPRGVAMIVEASHLCMMMRGVQKTAAVTTTSCMLGHFQTNENARTEFLNLIRRS